MGFMRNITRNFAIWLLTPGTHKLKRKSETQKSDNFKNLSILAKDLSLLSKSMCTVHLSLAVDSY